MNVQTNIDKSDETDTSEDTICEAIISDETYSGLRNALKGFIILERIQRVRNKIGLKHDAIIVLDGYAFSFNGERLLGTEPLMEASSLATLEHVLHNVNDAFAKFKEQHEAFLAKHPAKIKNAAASGPTTEPQTANPL